MGVTPRRGTLPAGLVKHEGGATELPPARVGHAGRDAGARRRLPAPRAPRGHIERLRQVSGPMTGEGADQRVAGLIRCPPTSWAPT